MSKDQVFQFFTKAAQKEQLKEKLQTVTSPDELVDLGKKEGFAFESDHVDEALEELKQNPGFFGKLAQAVVAVFSPSHDDYPAIGVEPYGGDPNENQ